MFRDSTFEFLNYYLVFGIILRILIASLLLTAGFLSSHFFLFKDTPFYKVAYLGQTLSAFLMAAVGLYLVPQMFKTLARAFKRWITAVIRSSVSHSVGSFMASQTSKFKVKSEKSKVGDDSGSPLLNVNGQMSNVILDTSVIIDGRVPEAVKLGFLEGKIIVPSFVLKELQTLADSSDDQKRIRGRRGLDLLAELKKYIEEEDGPAVRFEINDEEIKGKDADEKLLKLAKKLAARVATVDFNLNKAGRVSGVKILNVNDLANSIKTPLVPGDEIKIKIIHEGKDGSQGVGYLPDGTMIVVEGGKELLGQEVSVEVSRFLQTSAGKMVFGKLISS